MGKRKDYRHFLFEGIWKSISGQVLRIKIQNNERYRLLYDDGFFLSSNLVRIAIGAAGSSAVLLDFYRFPKNPIIVILGKNRIKFNGEVFRRYPWPGI